MENFFFAATTSSKGKHRKEDSSRHDLKRTLCIRMAVSILCLAMNPKAIFLQTLIGLIAYAYGLKDLGFNILNMLGCCCSIDQVRNHGSYWAKNRTASEELLRENVALWRVSFDNLNYKMKYAKKLTTAGPNKMLNLKSVFGI